MVVSSVVWLPTPNLDGETKRLPELPINFVLQS